MAWVMMVTFSLSGLMLLFLFGSELISRIKRRHSLIRTMGTIVEIKTKTMTTRNSTLAQKLMHFPIIEYQRRNGHSVKFTSETGDLGAGSRYQIGQSIQVLYDEDGKLGPMIATWSGIWLPNLMGILSGLIFLIGAALVYIGFRDQL